MSGLVCTMLSPKPVYIMNWSSNCFLHCEVRFLKQDELDQNHLTSFLLWKLRLFQSTCSWWN